MPARPRHITSILKQQRKLASLNNQVQQQQQLLKLVRDILPDPLPKHCLGAILNGSSLTILVDSPVWHAKLRFFSPRLLGDLRRHIPGLANIQTRIFQSREKPVIDIPQPSPRHSRQGAKTIATVSSDIRDPALRHALDRLAKALKPRE